MLCRGAGEGVKSNSPSSSSYLKVSSAASCSRRNSSKLSLVVAPMFHYSDAGGPGPGHRQIVSNSVRLDHQHLLPRARVGRKSNQVLAEIDTTAKAPASNTIRSYFSRGL